MLSATLQAEGQHAQWMDTLGNTPPAWLLLFAAGLSRAAVPLSTCWRLPAALQDRLRPRTTREFVELVVTARLLLLPACAAVGPAAAGAVHYCVAVAVGCCAPPRHQLAGSGSVES